MTPDSEPLRVVSFGGGVQSTALLALAAAGRIPHRTFLFANVGDDSENPATVRYVRDVAMPYAAAHDLTLVELHKTRRDGSRSTIWQEITRPGSRRELIPVRMSNGMPGNRSCTSEFKIKVLGKWLRGHGATAENPARVAIGFSTDEWRRVTNRRVSPYEVPEFPLIDLNLSRDGCKQVIADAGLPEPERSACWFCPFHSRAGWESVAADTPELFLHAVWLERLLNARRMQRGMRPVWLSRQARPLDEAFAAAAPDHDEGPERCDSGHCWT